jgi:uncharacterized protein (TIGR02646 family)
MIKIAPYFDDAPSKLWKEASKKRNKTKSNPQGNSKIELALSQQSAHDFDSKIYGSKAVKDKLKTIFNKKCAFCETNTHAGAHKDIEHYRFKNHYYWLGYEWTNLLLSCQICNRDFKKTQFPIADENTRLKKHPLNISGDFDSVACDIRQINKIEKPRLLHPAIEEDDPKKHLLFLKNGSVEGLSDRGNFTIDICGLKRDDLKIARKKIVEEVQIEILEEYIVKNQLSDEELITEVRKAINGLKRRIKNNEEYIGFAETVLENFDAFIIDNQDLGLDMPDKDRIRVIAQMLL